MAGEHSATLVTGDWRRWSENRLGEVADGPLSEFMTGKQVEVILPRHMYPNYQGSWKVTCQRPITQRNKEVSMRMIFTGYSGDKHLLSDKDLECLSKHQDLWVDIPMSPKKQNQNRSGEINLRDL